MNDLVSHEELQAELERLRSAIMLLASLSEHLGTDDGRRIRDWLQPPSERKQGA